MPEIVIRGRRRRRFAFEPRTGASILASDKATGIALKEMRCGGVDIDHAPKAFDLLIDARTPVQDHPVLRERERQGAAANSNPLFSTVFGVRYENNFNCARRPSYVRYPPSQV